MKGSTTVTPSIGLEANEVGKNDVYLPVNAKIIIEGNLITHYKLKEMKTDNVIVDKSKGVCVEGNRLVQKALCYEP